MVRLYSENNDRQGTTSIFAVNIFEALEHAKLGQREFVKVFQTGPPQLEAFLGTQLLGGVLGAAFLGTQLLKEGFDCSPDWLFSSLGYDFYTRRG